MVISFVCTCFLNLMLTMLFDTNLGPDRRIFLPDGLLDRSEIPEYLNGEVPGEYGSIFFYPPHHCSSMFRLQWKLNSNTLFYLVCYSYGYDPFGLSKKPEDFTK